MRTKAFFRSIEVKKQKPNTPKTMGELRWANSTPEERSAFASVGAAAAAAKMTPEQRKERAKLAAKKRWANHAKKQPIENK